MAGVHDPMWPFYHRDDVNAAVAFLYQIITKNEKYNAELPDAEADELVRARGKWVKHPNVFLDHALGRAQLSASQASHHLGA